MAEVTLTAETGRPTGSSASRRLRKEGHVPGVVYGHSMEPLSVSVGARELRTVLSTYGLNQVLTLRVDGSEHLVLARQLQRHPVRHTVSHVDFQVVRRDEVVHANVALVVSGTAASVNREGGVLEHVLSTLTIKSTPDRIPAEITVDVSDLQVGDTIRVRDLPLPEGVTTDVDPDETVVVAASAVVRVAETAEEAQATEGAAGEVVEPAATEEG